MRTLSTTSLLIAVTLAATACGGPAAPEATSTPTTAVSPSTAEAMVDETTAPGGGEAAGPTATPPPAAATEVTVSVDGRDCSTQGRGVGDAELSLLPEAARATAALLLDAATRCDEQLLTTAATESRTTLSFGDLEPGEAFGLPDDDHRYANLVTLLAELPWAAQADDTTPATFVWPRVATTEWQDDDQAWQEVVDAGMLAADEARQMREAGSGYLGWRIGIRGDGNWMFFVAGD